MPTGAAPHPRRTPSSGRGPPGGIIAAYSRRRSPAMRTPGLPASIFWGTGRVNPGSGEAPADLRLVPQRTGGATLGPPCLSTSPSGRPNRSERRSRPRSLRNKGLDPLTRLRRQLQEVDAHPLGVGPPRARVAIDLEPSVAPALDWDPSRRGLRHSSLRHHRPPSWDGLSRLPSATHPRGRPSPPPPPAGASGAADPRWRVGYASGTGDTRRPADSGTAPETP